MLWDSRSSLKNLPSPHPDPPPDFANRPLPTVEITSCCYRLNPVRYDSALYFDRSGKGRFDAPEQSYSILYVGADEYAAFIECYGRQHGARGVAESALQRAKFDRYYLSTSFNLC